MKLVEFLGAPGAGKSTTMAATMEVLDISDRSILDLDRAIRLAIETHGGDALTRAAARLTRSSSSKTWIRAYDRSTDRLNALSRFLSAHPDLMEVVMAAQRQRASRDLNPNLVLRWILNLMAGHQLASEALGDKEWLAIDEGFTQRAVALVAHGFVESEEAVLLHYLEAMPRSTVLVFVDTPIATCAQRLDSRGWPERMNDQGSAERQDFLSNAGKAAAILADGAEAMGTVVIRVDGTAARSELSDHISDLGIFQD